LILCNSSYAAKTFTVYTVEEGDTLTSISYSFVSKYLPEKLDEIKSYTTELIYWNPHIEDWSKLKKGTSVYLGYPFPSSVEDRSHPLSKYTMSGFYNFSSGKLDETISSSSTTVESTQNSILSLGLQARYNIYSWEKLISASLYFSQLQVTSVKGGPSGQAQILHFPPEFGSNVYYQFYIKKFSLQPYVGIDYESLNTFNSKDLLLGQPLVTRTNKLIYGTFGLAHGKAISNFTLLTKASLSKTIITSTSSSFSSDKYGGYKAIVSLGFKENTSPWLFNFFYKVHLLSGPTELVINRFGAGIGFSFF
jgi:hypothetical protein